MSDDALVADNSDIPWNKLAASEEVATLREVRNKIWEEHSHSFRWLMASLLAISGAACLAVLGLEKLDLTYKFVSSRFFVGGILFALLVAVLGQHISQNSLTPLQNQIGYWMSVAEDGERVKARETELSLEMSASSKLGTAARACGWLAAILFVCGIVAFGFGMKKYEDSKKSLKNFDRTKSSSK